MKKTLLAIVLFAVMLITVACNKPNIGDNSGTSSGGALQAPIVDAFEVPEIGYDSTQQITIKFSHTMGTNLSDVLDVYIKEFNTLYPNIQVEWEKVGGYDDVRDQINKQITVGNQPNVAYCYPDHVATYNLSKSVVALDNLIDSQIEVTRADGTTESLGLTQEQKDDIIKGYYEEGRQFGDGQMYTMPLSKSTEVLYYNKTVFDKIGLSVPDHWWCLDSCSADCKTSMEYVCAQLKAQNKESTPLGYDSEANWFITMTEQMKTPYTTATSGNHFLFNTAENRAFIKRFNSWYNQGWITTQELYGKYTSGLFTNREDNKISYMSIGSSAGATHQRPNKEEQDKLDENGEPILNEDGTTVKESVYPFEVGIAPIPQYDVNNQKVISQGPSLCIFGKEDPQEVVATWLFVKFLVTNVDFQAEFAAASGYVPVLKSVENHPVYSKKLAEADGYENIAYLSAKVCLEQEENYFTSPAFNGSSTARDQVGLLLKNCISAQQTGSELDSFIANEFQNAIDECEYQA